MFACNATAKGDKSQGYMNIIFPDYIKIILYVKVLISFSLRFSIWTKRALNDLIREWTAFVIK